MKKDTATTIFESLSSGIRLDAYRLLVKQGPQGLVAGEIGSMLGVPPTNLSFHLKALTQSGLLTVEQEGRFQRYRANVPVMQALIDYLTAECCAGHPEQCVEISSGPHGIDAMPVPKSGPAPTTAAGKPAGTSRLARLQTAKTSSRPKTTKQTKSTEPVKISDHQA